MRSTSPGGTYLLITFEHKLPCVPEAPESCTSTREATVIFDPDPWQARGECVPREVAGVNVTGGRSNQESDQQGGHEGRREVH
jgi:hypothetical protein